MPEFWGWLVGKGQRYPTLSLSAVVRLARFTLRK